MNIANFGPIDAQAGVYGACRPGHLGGDVPAWADVLDSADVSTVVCLLSESEAKRWRLPDKYADVFDAHHVPIRDRHLPDSEALHHALDVLETATADDRRAAIHCNAGLGRVGVVGTAWLVHAHDLAPREAMQSIETGPARRSPREAVRDGNATEADVVDLLSTLR